ncbi:MAG: hypothetical protein Q8O67_06385 [Deltaproteobacteria bacterium]|nr:hypothetical protein [Deltaproteobacteria bacterium]
MRRLTAALLLLSVLLGGVGCRPLLDGAWEGEADCTDTGAHRLSGLFNEDADGELEGSIFIEDIDFFGGELTLRTDLDDGEFDADDNDYSFDLQADADAAPEFSGKLELDAEDPDELDGDLDQFDDDGAVTQTCSFALDRVDVAD